MKPALLIIMGATLAGCAARSLPPTFPNSSASSPDAVEAPKPAVLTALRGDPPLPGEPASEWAGLEEPGSDQPTADAAAPVAGPPSTKAPDHGYQQQAH